MATLSASLRRLTIQKSREMRKPAYSNVLYLMTVFAVFSVKSASGKGKVIFAVNAGGEEHTDVNGIKFVKDPLEGKIGVASDYGRQ